MMITNARVYHPMATFMNPLMNVSVGVMQGVTNRYIDLMNEKKISLATNLYTSLLSRLNSLEFQTAYYPGEVPKLDENKADTYVHINLDADILINVWYGNSGYFAESSKPYQPFVTLFIRIVDAKSKKPLFFQTYRVGAKIEDGNVLFVPSDQNFNYKDPNEIFNNFDQSIEWLIMTQEKGVQQFVQTLI